MITFDDYKSLLQEQFAIQRKVGEFEHNLLTAILAAYCEQNPGLKVRGKSDFRLALFQPWKRDNGRVVFPHLNSSYSILAETEGYVVTLNNLCDNYSDPPYQVLAKESEEK